MPRGQLYEHEYIRVTEREKALKTVATAHKLIEDKMKLVREGKLRMVKIPINRGFKITFEEI
jgi:uncharacterized beta-barrel protein YwiB (DUF1934 family)